MQQYVQNPEANKQINIIASLLAKGHSDESVVQLLKAQNVRNLAQSDGSWTTEDVKKLRIDFQLKANNRSAIEQVLLTTETQTDLPILERIEVISAETAFGMNLFRDFFAGVRDTFGGRSVATQKVLRDARRTVLFELKQEAYQLGANAVVGVDLDYSEFSGGGKSMLFVVATGTAVRITESAKPR